MSLLKFRRARCMGAGTAANIATRTMGAIRGCPKNCVALGMNPTSQRGSLNAVGRRGIHQHGPMASSSSLFLRNSRREMHQKSTVKLSRPTSNCNSSSSNYARRSFSFYNNNPGQGQQPNMGNPAYTVYGEETAFTLKAIPPEFRTLPSGTVILDASKRGRLLFEWTPMASGQDDVGYGSGKRRYRWDASTRFALTAEEAGSLLAKLDRGDPSVEFSRRISGEQTGQQSLDKVFIAKPIELEGTAKNDGISLLVDYVDPDNHQLGQMLHPQRISSGTGGSPFEDEGLKGPFEIRLMVGEYQVLRSIIEYSIPRLVGWSTTFDRNIEHAVFKSVQGGGSSQQQRGNMGGSPHNYQGGGGGDY